MAAPFCTICKGLGDETEARLGSQAFPLCIPKDVYPCGCGDRGGRDSDSCPSEAVRRWHGAGYSSIGKKGWQRRGTGGNGNSRAQRLQETRETFRACLYLDTPENERARPDRA